MTYASTTESPVPITVKSAAGTAALTDFLEGLRKAGEADLVSTILRDQWREVAKAVDAKKERK